MPTEIKQVFNGGLDFDTALSFLPKESYIDALNITHDAVQGSNDEQITNLVSNVKIPYNYPAGSGVTIGFYAFPLRNTAIFFRYNSNGRNGVYEYNATTNVITKIFECITDSATDILGFTENTKITSVNIYPRDEGDLLFFLDGEGRPTMMNIDRFKAGEYTPVTRQVINVIKAPPLRPPSAIFGNDTTFNANYFRNKAVRFAQLFVYDEFQESVFSPISEMPLQYNILDQTYTNIQTNNNVVNLGIDSGTKDVKAIKVLMSYADKSSNWSNFVVIDTINKADVVLAVDLTERTQGTTQLAYAIFSGVVTEGTVVTVKIRRISDGVVLTAGTYTTVAGDTIVDIVSTLQTALIGSGYMIAVSNAGSGLYFNFDNTLYDTPQVDIVNAITSTDNIIFPFSFYNDSTYPVYNVDRETQLFDWVPDAATCQEMPNGDVLAYAGVTEGYNRDLVPNVVNDVLVRSVAGGVTGNLNGVVSIALDNSLTQIFSVTFSGQPAVGTVVNIRIRVVGTGAIVLAATYTTIFGDTSTSVAAAIKNSFDNIGEVLDAQVNGDVVVVFTNSVVSPKRVFESLEVNPPALSAATNSIPTWLWSTSRNIGLVYFDQNGKTNGVLYNSKITFPAYSESGGNIQIPYINTRIYHLPPIWAYSFQIVFTKESTSYYKFWESSDVVITDSDYLYFNVTGFKITQLKNPTVAPVLNYGFVPGDRMRLIKNTTSGTVFNDTYDATIEGLVTDPTIASVVTVGDFIKIRKTSPFSGVDYSSKFFVIEIYRPGQASANEKNETYYECGLQYPILNPGTNDRIHGGQVTDQIIISNTPAEFNIYNGDSYFRPRVIYLSDTGVGLFNVQDSNFVDFYLSDVSSLEGRPSLIDENAKTTFFGAVIRHGRAYQANTNVNALNQFPFENFIEASYFYGIIERMKVRDKMLRIFQTNKTGFSPLFSQIHREGGGLLVAQTDKLLNPIQYYVGDWGIGTAGTSLASFNFADYFCDNIRGAVVRLSNDGETPLSIVYKINSWANDQIPARVGNYKIYGAFDQRLSNYVISLEQTDKLPATTLIFDEEKNRFDSFASFHAEMMGCLGTLFMSFKGGDLYTHNGTSYNEFYGVKYPSSITPVFNKDVAVKKKYNAIGYQSKDNKVWYAPLIFTSTINSQTGLRQESSLIEKDVVLEESVLTAALLRDKNSMADRREALLEGDFLGGNFIAIKFEISAQNASSLVSLIQPYLSYQISQRNF